MSNIPEGCKPFNLQDALAGNPVVTRDGRAVKIAGYNPDAGVGQYHQVIGWLDSKVKGFNESGSWNGTMSDNDLFMAPETKDVWVILMQRSFGLLAVVRETKEEAEAFCSNVDEILLGKTYGIHKITINI